MSDYLEDALGERERSTMELHLKACCACRELLGGMQHVLEWGKAFPVYTTPAWLPGRIVANTPRVARETWLDTLKAAWRLVSEPRIAMAVFTATLVIAWMGDVTGFHPDVRTIARNPAAIYYGAGDLMNRAYDRAVRTYYRSPFVIQIQSEIQSRIEEFRENS